MQGLTGAGGQNWRVRTSDISVQNNKGSYTGSCSNQAAGNGDKAGFHMETVSVGGKTYTKEQFSFLEGGKRTGHTTFGSGEDSVQLSSGAFESAKKSLGVNIPECKLQ